MRQHRSTLLLFVLLTALSLCSLFIGVIDLRAGSILAGDFTQLEVLFISRLPRLLAILCTGVGMSTAGLIMQQLCQNKFVSPTTGATISSAQLGILIALVFMPRSTLWGRAFFSAVCAVAGTWVVVLFISVATALAGPISFLGLIIANLSRQLFCTYRHTDLTAGAFLIGAVLLIAGQLLVEQVYTYSIPISVFITVGGGIYFLYLLLAQRKRG